MEQNMSLSFGFKGAATNVNGVPQSNATVPLTRGGIISDAAGNSGLTAQFGYAVSEVPATPTEFLIGIQAAADFAGIIIADPAVMENEPGKPDSFISKTPVTICYFGPVWYSSWTTTAAGAIDPVVGCKVITEDATGKIEFVGALTAVPANWTGILARVIEVDAEVNGALVFLGLPLSTVL